MSRLLRTRLSVSFELRAVFFRCVLCTLLLGLFELRSQRLDFFSQGFNHLQGAALDFFLSLSQGISLFLHHLNQHELFHFFACLLNDGLSLGCFHLGEGRQPQGFREGSLFQVRLQGSEFSLAPVHLIHDSSRVRGRLKMKKVSVLASFYTPPRVPQGGGVDKSQTHRSPLDPQGRYEGDCRSAHTHKARRWLGSTLA